MNNDKELLTLAAKAAGIELIHWNEHERVFFVGKYPVIEEWDPLYNDGDALRLAVKLDMNVEVWNPFKEVWVVAEGYDVIEEPWGGDKLAATRRAIVRAASEIGRGME
jgi:hypothetical protein